MAYVDSYFDIQDTEWTDFERRSKRPLAVGMNEMWPQGPYVLTQKRELEGFVIRKTVEPVVLGSQRVYKTSAQSKQEIEGPRWLKGLVAEPTHLGREPGVESVQNLMAARRVTGPIELTRGLAVTNEHHIEIRRSDEGIFREMGRVDLAKGNYSIDIDEASGAIVARLIDKTGTVLGEGSIRLSQLHIGEGRLVFGPRLEVSPSPSWKGRVSYRYPNVNKQTVASTRVSTFGGQNILNFGDHGELDLENIAKNTTTVVRAEAPDHMPTTKIITVSSTPFEVPLFPNSMVEALRSIVADQERIPLSRLAESSVVWGTVSLDGTPISGVTVVSESEPEATVIYFNEFLIPDPKLTATSASGQFAFVNLQEGFHALLARRGDAYFGHQNVLAEAGSVALGDIENTLRTESVKLRSFDAFSGEPIVTIANLQSLSESVDMANGSASIVLPQVSRFSMIYAETSPEYIPANYFYNEEDSYIHLPMVSQAWLSEIKTVAQINEQPETGTVIGFFGEEKYEAYLASKDQSPAMSIVYFDATGRLVSGNQGVAGGGFVMFNIPKGAHEVVIVGTSSERAHSKIAPIDVGSVSIMSFSSH